MSLKTLSKWTPPYLAVWAGLFLFHNAWAAMLGLHISFILIIVLSKSTVSPTILLKTMGFKWIIINLLLCGSSGFIIFFFLPFLELSANFRVQLAQLGLTPSNLPAFITYFSLVNPFLEEYFWRAFHGNDMKGFYFGDLLYAGYHAIVLINQIPLLLTLFSVACLTFIGWFWRQVKREDHGQLATVLGHMAADFSVMMAVYLIIR